ncbi:MAG: prolipoprotein diacylglyceryl transferase [Simkaniaceae bacterium]
MIVPLAWVVWNPSKDLITLPFLSFPVRWYGVLFAFGFFLAYLVAFRLIRDKLFKNPKFQSFEINEALIKKHLTNSSHPLTKLLGKGGEEGEILKRLNQALGASSNRLLFRLELEKVCPECFLTLKKRSHQILESLTNHIVIATVAGARLGHILFYENISEFLIDPLRILKIREGGLASHGAAIAILISLFFLSFRLKKRGESFSFLQLLDLVVIPTALAGGFIRLGNFINQEIIGRISTVPWAVVFQNPASGGAIAPRHPVQLYEAGFYFFCFLILITFARKGKGFASGLFLTLVFSFRFFIEFFKEPQSALIGVDASFLMGQYLSLPFAFTGLYLLTRIFWTKRYHRKLLSHKFR